MEKRSVLHVLTVVDPVTNVASPAPLVDELDERIDVGAALPTSAKTKRIHECKAPLSTCVVSHTYLTIVWHCMTGR